MAVGNPALVGSQLPPSLLPLTLLPATARVMRKKGPAQAELGLSYVLRFLRRLGFESCFLQGLTHGFLFQGQCGEPLVFHHGEAGLKALSQHHSGPDVPR